MLIFTYHLSKDEEEKQNYRVRQSEAVRQAPLETGTLGGQSVGAYGLYSLNLS